MSGKLIPEPDYMSKLKPGQKGEIVVNAGVYKGRYPTRVEDFKGELIGLAHPLLKGALLPAYRDLSFTLSLDDGGALYIYEMSVKRAENLSGLPILWASLDGAPKRVQRRQFLRVACLWDIVVFHLDEEEMHPLSMTWMDAKAIDISLGGCRFRMPSHESDRIAFESGEKLLLRFGLDDKTYFQMGRTSRVANPSNNWEIGVVFDSVPSSVEKKLFEYIRQQEIMGREQKK